jgi:hypothetical protein
MACSAARNGHPARPVNSIVSHQLSDMFPSREYPAILGALIVLNWPLYVAIFKLAFRDSADLKQSVWYSATPVFLWIYRRKWMESMWGAGRLAGSFLICGLIVSFEYFVICEIIARSTT